MNRLTTFLRNWTLPTAMFAGVAGYFTYISIPALDATHTLANHVVGVIQPMLIFCMLFLTFCRVKPQDLHLCRWHLWLLLFQLGIFAACTWIITCIPADNHWRLVLEGGMLCIICPTATAAAVVTAKLGGQPGSLTTYTILINLCVAISVPALVPLIHPDSSLTFIHSFILIISKVFPLLFCPFLTSSILRYIAPRLIDWCATKASYSFYMWAVALALAIAVTTKSIMHSNCPIEYLLGIACASLIACIIQFAFGRFIGRKYHDFIAASQSLGQKNTVFAIWMGYTFMSPVTSIAGGFYSIWHNVYNSWQLYEYRKKHA